MIRIAACLSTLLFMSGLLVQHGFADDDDEYAADALHAQNDIKWGQMSVRIVDPEGQPIVGAKVRPWALRAGNGHGWWQEEAYGAPKQTLTDATGKTDVVFPASVEYFERHDVVQVSMFVSHPDFCTKNAHVDVPSADPLIVPTVNLERGVRLRIAGVAPGSDQPLSDCHVMLEDSESGDDEFVREADGWMQSIPIREDRRWFRVIRAPVGAPAEFSKPQAWDPDDPASREVRVEVRPGVRVTGKISDDVPRPIDRGQVVAWCGSPMRHDAGNNQKHARSIWWIDTVPVNKDGTFEFPSLPSGYLAQFYAIANDSISAQPTDEAYETCCNWFAEQNRQRHATFRYGQILRLAGTKAQITIEMEPAGQVRVKCVAPNGRPLKGISVSSWPNQYMVGGGSTIFCTQQSSLEHLRNKRQAYWSHTGFFTVETDADGIALMRNLPQGKQSLVAGDAIWTTAQEYHVTSDPKKVAEFKITMRRAAEKNEDPVLEKAKKWLEKLLR